MQAITTIGLDIAKSVFQVHGVDAAGQVLIRRQFTASSSKSSCYARPDHTLGQAERLAASIFRPK